MRTVPFNLDISLDAKFFVIGKRFFHKIVTRAVAVSFE